MPMFRLKLNYWSHLHGSDFVTEAGSDAGIDVDANDGHLMGRGLRHAVHGGDVAQGARVQQDLLIIRTLRPETLVGDIGCLLRNDHTLILRSPTPLIDYTTRVILI